MSRVRFTKMAGAGNDFLIVEAGRAKGPAPAWAAFSRAACDRHRGVGADGVLVLERSRRADARMRIFNPDGSEAAMCGNGARCAARYLAEERRPRGGTVSLETRAGVLSAAVRGGRIALRMPEPSGLSFGHRLDVGGERCEVARIDTGVPHAVLRVAGLGAADVERIGRALRRHSLFAPAGTNVDFMEADPARPDRLRVRTYERGVEAETLACGTGIVAAAIVHALTRPRPAGRGFGGGALRGRRERIEVRPKSGDRLAVSFQVLEDRPPRVTGVVLEGPARRVCEGVFLWAPAGSGNGEAKDAR